MREISQLWARPKRVRYSSIHALTPIASCLNCSGHQPHLHHPSNNSAHHHHHSTSSQASTLKAARAALMLVPILGLNFILLPMQPEKGSALEAYYQIVSAVSSSYQVSGNN